MRRDHAASVTFTVPDGDALLRAAIRELDPHGIAVLRATGVPPTLDDVFLALTGRTLREAGEGQAPAEEAAAAAEASTTQQTEKAGAIR